MMRSCTRLCYSITIHHLHETDCHQQKLFGRPLQDTLPAHSRSFASKWQTWADEAESKAVATQQSAKNYYKKGAHYLPDIQEGSMLLYQLITLGFFVP